MGSFYSVKKSEAGPLNAAENDKTPVPKCAPEDKCDWTCDVPKAPGSKETETKTVTTVGEFAKWCIVPSLVSG